MKKLKHPNPKTCAKCPRRYDPEGCEKWIDIEDGFKEVNPITQEEKIVTGCFYKVMPKILVHVVKSSNEAAAAANGARNKVAALGQLIPIVVDQGGIKPRLINAEEVLQLSKQ